MVSMSTSGKPDSVAIHALAVETITAPRPVTTQVLDHILAQHEVSSEKVNDWLVAELSSLEPYELDLLLSPLFTPDFPTRSRFEPCLGSGQLTSGELTGLIEKLADESLEVPLLHEGVSVRTTVPHVVVDRFLRLLHLDAPLPEEAHAELATLPTDVRCLLRDRAWQRRGSRRVLPDLLEAVRRTGQDMTDYVRFITDFVRTHRPNTREECAVFLGNLAEACEQDLKSYESGARSFFNVELKTTHAGKWKPRDEIIREHRATIEKARALSLLLD